MSDAKTSTSAQPEQIAVPLHTRVVRIEGKRGVVVEGSNAAWVPSEAVLTRLERAFPEKLVEHAERGRCVASYFRQYWGQMQDGEPIIEIELFRTPPPGIEHRPVLMFDGGPDHATTWYSPTRDAFLGLMGGPC